MTVVIGIAFMLSGFANALVLGSSANILAFGPPNVVFSEVAGGLLVILGASGRFTGRLPSGNPYRRERHTDEASDVLPTVYPGPEDRAAAAELAEAERAVARGRPTPAQAHAVEVAGRHRRPEVRVRGWRAEAGESDPGTTTREERDRR